MLNEKKILVTGHKGFIGSNFVEILRQKYPRSTIAGLDKYTYAAINNPPVSHEYVCDIADDIVMKRIFDVFQPNIIVHFAAQSHVDNSIKDPYETITTNVIGTNVLLDLAKEYNVETFLQVSTDEVYGDYADMESKYEGGFYYGQHEKPSSPYSVAKQAADNLCRAYKRMYGLNTIVTRCSNNIGRGQDPSKFVPKVIKALHNGEEISVFGLGDQKRDWLHVEDHCLKIIDALTYGRCHKINSEMPVYHFGSGKNMTNMEMINLISDVVGINHIKIKQVPDRLGHDKEYLMNDDFSHISTGKTIRDAIKELYDDMLERKMVYGLK